MTMIFFFLLLITCSLVSGAFGRNYHESNFDLASRTAQAEILPFRRHTPFSQEDSLMVNYSIAALTAIKVSQASSDLHQKLPQHLCPLKKYKCIYGDYRRFDGRCTNIFFPLSGSAYSSFSRRLLASYDDNISVPRFHGSRNRLLPPPGIVEKQIARVPAAFPIPISRLFIEVSEFLYSDLASFVKIQEGLGCCGSGSVGECLSIGDLFHDCYIRSAPSPLKHCSLGQREQMNVATAFIDAGPIYQNWRDLSKGTIESDFSLQSSSSSSSLHSPSLSSPISSFHRLLIDEHNWVIQKLQKTYPGVQMNILFEEARKFVIAEVQHIIFEQFLPILIGEETIEKYDLRAPHCDKELCHEVEANTLNEYGSAVGLFHKFMTAADKSSIFNPSHYMATEFSTLHTTSTASDVLSPKLSELILIGRDHGIATYAQWRKECGGGELESYEQLIGMIDDRILKSVRDIFPDIRDVDLIILGVAENPVYGSILGPTFGCIMALQLQKTKFGDSYWYTNRLNKEQIEEVEKVSISGMMCRHQKISMIPKNSLRAADNFQQVNIPLFCNSSVFSTPDFTKWIATDEKPRNSEFDDVLDECTLEVKRARSYRKPKTLQDGLHDSVALKSYGSMMLAKDEAVNEANISFILLEATKKLVKHKNVALSSIQGVYIGEGDKYNVSDQCTPKDLPCDSTNPYRSYTGWCNNLEFPSYGNTFRELKRLLPPDYDDQIDLPRSKSTSGARLPSPRAISNVVHHSKKIEHVKYSHFVMEFGQFIDHDITHSPVDQNSDGTPLNCSKCDSNRDISPSCFPIPVPVNDLHFEPYSCLSFVRSLPAQKTLGHRNQMNQVSSFLDGSVMYGSTKCEGDRLRTFQDGKMKTTRISNSRRHYGITLSQSDEAEQDGCVSSPEAPCFIAGDDRNSQQTLLIAVHTIFHREHERLATLLKEMNPQWEDEQIYQETRKLISAQFSHIVYNEYLPIIIGQKLIDEYGLRPKRDGYFTGYENCDASILQPFATAAFRFGHSTVTRFTPMQETVHSPATRVVDLASDFLNMSKIYNDDAVEKILGGMHAKNQMMTDRFVDDAVRNFLFSDRGRRGTGLDLIAINIQRGRDHGIPSYNHFRDFCGFPRLTSFYSVFSDIDQDGLTAIGKVYESPDDIDLFTGIISENVVPGAIVGPTAACIIAEQFRRLKKCDRNPIINCDFYSKLDLTKWRDAQNCIYENKYIPLHTAVEISPCTKCICSSDGIKCAFLKPDCFSHPKETLAEESLKLICTGI
ncbi:unnamed protein product [Caenorhabditis brenneri]